MIQVDVSDTGALSAWTSENRLNLLSSDKETSGRRPVDLTLDRRAHYGKYGPGQSRGGAVSASPCVGGADADP